MLEEGPVGVEPRPDADQPNKDPNAVVVTCAEDVSGITAEDTLECVILPAMRRGALWRRALNASSSGPQPRPARPAVRRRLGARLRIGSLAEPLGLASRP